MAEQTDFLSSMRALIQSELVDLNTSLNGEIVAYSNGKATVKPLANKLFQDGDSLPFPMLYNVPIRWPSFNGGKCGIKGPVTAGDKVLLVFAQQATDGTDDARRHDLTDAYAVIVSNETSSQGANNEDMIMWFGDAYIKLTASGALEINAPSGTKIIAPNNEFTGNQLIDGNQQTVGSITGLGGMAITGGTGSTATITGSMSINGTVTHTGSLTNNGKNIGHTHTHGGVQTGGGTSGVVT